MIHIHIFSFLYISLYTPQSSPGYLRVPLFLEKERSLDRSLSPVQSHTPATRSGLWLDCEVNSLFFNLGLSPVTLRQPETDCGWIVKLTVCFLIWDCLQSHCGNPKWPVVWIVK
jgi:hypothetical protein